MSALRPAWHTGACLLEYIRGGLAHLPRRRKYGQLFDEIQANPELVHANSSFHLTLIGQGQVDLPPQLASKVTKLSGLNYRVRPFPAGSLCVLWPLPCQPVAACCCCCCCIHEACLTTPTTSQLCRQGCSLSPCVPAEHSTAA